MSEEQVPYTAHSEAHDVSRRPIKLRDPDKPNMDEMYAGCLQRIAAALEYIAVRTEAMRAVMAAEYEVRYAQKPKTVRRRKAPVAKASARKAPVAKASARKANTKKKAARRR